MQHALIDITHPLSRDSEGRSAMIKNRRVKELKRESMRSAVPIESMAVDDGRPFVSSSARKRSPSCHCGNCNECLRRKAHSNWRLRAAQVQRDNRIALIYQQEIFPPWYLSASRRSSHEGDSL